MRGTGRPYGECMPESRLLQPGDIIVLDEKHCVYAAVPKHFVFANKRGDFSTQRAEVCLATSWATYLCGKYVVTEVRTDGGGPSFDGGFPDGHHVFCESFDDRSREVDFYQTGCFTAMIKEITPIGRATLMWIEAP